MIYDSESIKVSHIDNYIYQEYIGLVGAKEWKESFNAGVEYFYKNGILYWINDLSRFWGTDCENVIWLHKNVNQKLKGLDKLHKIAFVPPKEEFEEANRSMNFYIQYSNADFIGHNIIIDKFPTLERAKLWLGM